MNTTPYTTQNNRMLPVHPGEILQEEFLAPMQLTQYRLAKDIHVPPRRINEIVLGKRRITADTALRLARYFGTTARFWMNLQTRYDLDIAQDTLGATLHQQVQAYSAVHEPPTEYKKGDDSEKQ